VPKPYLKILNYEVHFQDLKKYLILPKCTYYISYLKNYGNSKCSDLVIEILYFIYCSWQFNPFSPTCATFFAEHCNPITRQVIWARELFKPSTDSASLVVKIEKNFFVLGLSFSGGNVTSRALFALFWPSLSGPERCPNGPFFGLKV